MRVILSAKKVVTKRRNVCQCMEDDVHVVVCLGSRRGEGGRRRGRSRKEEGKRRKKGSK